MTVLITTRETSSDNIQQAPSTRQENQIGAVKFKKRTRKGFREDVGRVFGTGNVRENKVFGMNVRTNEMKSNVYMLGAIMGNSVVRKSDCPFVVRSDGNRRRGFDGKLIEIIFKPNTLLEGAGHRHVLGFGC